MVLGGIFRRHGRTGEPHNTPLHRRCFRHRDRVTTRNRSHATVPSAASSPLTTALVSSSRDMAASQDRPGGTAP